jgi:threonine/homoserine/homoserine lactone efflux protein
MPTDPAFSPALLVALFVFAAVGSITPGPNNIMLMVSGVNFGIRRTVPQMAGIAAGLYLITAATGLGLGFVFSHFPLVRIAMMLAGVGYSLWLACQAINPKLWATAITAVALYVRPGHTLTDTMLVTGTFAVINVPAMLVWAGFGVGLRRALQEPGRVRIFNIVMGLSLAASVLAFLRV